MHVDPHREFTEQNRRSWNEATPGHNRHKHDQAGFLRRGGSTLFPEELELLGGQVGKRLLHMQCNCGQDTLSLARLGARVTGVDISDAAIDFARRLSDDAAITADFERAELVTWLNQAAAAGRRFDTAFCSYGSLGWLPDLRAWADGVCGVLDPGGMLCVLEFHPLVWSFGPDGRVVEPYFLEQPIHDRTGVEDYVARSGDGLAPMGRVPDLGTFSNPEPSISFQWTVAGLVQAVADCGLRITRLVEYPFANGCRVFAGMRELAGRRFAMPVGLPDMPLMLGLVAQRA
jgi:SAM-dependent methyltransferase